MRTPFKSISALLLTFSLLPVSFAADNDKKLATVNGEPIMSSELIAYGRIKSPDANLKSPRVRQQLIQAYVGRELLYQEALEQGVDKLERVKLALENQRREIISQALVAKIMSDNPITEAEAKEFYKQQTDASNAAEYNARHILTKSEEAARRAIERLNGGESFDQVARDMSTDSSANRGGKIGWVNAAKMPPNFAAALKNSQVGNYSDTPVQTKFGWHVIQVDGSRPVSMPDFADIKDRLMQALTEKRVSEYIGQLQEKADIRILQ